MEINTYLSSFHFDELAANVIDLCPVGALTSMPFAFMTRPWELTTYENIDILDSLASSIRLDVCNNKIFRVLPVLDEAVNEEWITNKVRFFYDALSLQRLDYPKLRLENSLVVVSWDSILFLLLNFIFLKLFDNLECIFGHFVDLELTLAFKDFFLNFGCSNFSYESGFNFLTDFRFFFLLNSTISLFEYISTIIIIGSNLRLEVPLLNSRLRKNYLKNEYLKVFSLGLAVDYLTFPIINIGNSTRSLKLFFEGKNRFFRSFSFESFLNFEFLNFYFNFQGNYSFLVGPSISERYDNMAIINSLFHLLRSVFDRAFSSASLHFVSMYLGRLSCSELGLLEGVNSFKSRNFSSFSLPSLFFVCGTDSISLTDNSFIVYLGFFKANNFLLNKANIILPISAYMERVSTFLNIEGRLRVARKTIVPFKFIFHDVFLINALFFLKKRFFPYNFSRISSFYFILEFFSNLIDYKCFFNFNLKFLSARLFFLSGFILQLNLKFDLKNFVPIFLSSIRPLFYDVALINSSLDKTVNNYYSSDLFTKNSKILSLQALDSFSLNFSRFLKIY